MKRIPQKTVIEETDRTIPSSYSPFSTSSFISNATKGSYTPILVILLLVASFLLGMLYNKVQYLEKGGSTVLGQNTQNNNQPNNNNPPAGNTAPAPGTKVDVAEGHLPPMGDKNAKVKIVEFSDLECPFCKKYFDETFPQLKKEYVDTGKVVMYFRHYPLSFHPAAQPAAEASECANEQGKFWEYHDEVFKNQDQISGGGEKATTALKEFAATVGLNTDQFNSCLDSGKYKEAVTKDQSDGSAAGVSGTPSFYINGVQLVGAQPFSAFKTQIDAELAK